MTRPSAPRHHPRTVVANSTAIADPCLHRLQKVQQPTRLHHCCFRLDALIGYQPSLPRSHDAVPLTLNRSASLAQSESPYVTGALFTASRLSVLGRTVMIPGFPQRYRRIDWTFLMYSVDPQQFSNKLSILSFLSCEQLLFVCFTAFPSQCL